MTGEIENEWFETGQFKGKPSPHCSKFLRRDFVVPVEVIESRWPSWTPAERLRFAAAFSARSEMNDDDRRLLDFLMNNGDTRIWKTIARSVTKHRDRNRAINFLLTRLSDTTGPRANYYQALLQMAASECVPMLVEALAKHREEVKRHPSLRVWSHRFIYLDYLSCCATLFGLTGKPEYRTYLRKMLEHPDEAVRRQVRMIAESSGISLAEGST